MAFLINIDAINHIFIVLFSAYLWLAGWLAKQTLRNLIVLNGYIPAGQLKLRLALYHTAELHKIKYAHKNNGCIATKDV